MAEVRSQAAVPASSAFRRSGATNISLVTVLIAVGAIVNAVSR
jgi:hypothetical protein